MNLPTKFLGFALGGLALIPILVLAHRYLSGKARVAARYLGVAAILALFFGAMRHVDAHDRAVDVTKAILAIVAAGAVFYEQHRAGMRRPVSERWKRFVGVCLALGAVTCYFGGFKFGYHKFYHRWDQYHYYMGAKYFHEMGYDGLYKCTAIAQDELGTVIAGPPDLELLVERRLDMKREVRHPDRKIRNLGGDNLLMPVAEVLEHPEACKAHFSPERWDEYKEDVRFFRMASDKTYWDDMQKDHGYNPPPVWTVAGHAFASLYPAGRVFELPVIGKTVFLQLLAMLDVAYLLGMFAALSWAFGWRVFAVAAIVFGCQASAPAYWTLGAFLRQDWLFWLVLSVCAARKRYFWLAGGAMVYASLLRIFPGLTIVGWLVVAGFQLARHRRLTAPMWRLLGGGVIAAALLVPLSVRVAGAESYREFYRHTLQVHDRTPLTNHMGLRVLIAQKVPFEIEALGIGVGPRSGRMKYTKDGKLTDPFEVWKRMRNERYDKLKSVAWAVTALSLGFFAFVARRLRSLWIAHCLSAVFVILMSQLTCYYYTFLILLAPLTRAKRSLEVPLFGLCALTQGVYVAFFHFDDRYWALTAISLAFCYGALCSFMSRADRDKVRAYFGRTRTA